MRGAGSKPRHGKAARPRPAARNLCEEFAPRDGAARARGEGGANRALEKPAVGPLISKNPARGSRPETENKGLAGSRARTMPAVGPRIPKFPARGSRSETENKGFAGSRARTKPAAGPPNLETPGPRFAPGNQKQRASGEPSANHAGHRTSNLETPGRGSRPETENKGFAGSRARTMPAGGPPNPKHPAGRRASNPEIPGREPCRPPGPLCLPEDLQVCPPGPSHFRRTRSGRPPSPLCFPAGRAPTKKHRAAARCLLLSY